MMGGVPMKLKLALDAGHGKNTAGKRCLKSLDPKETREWVLNSRIAEKVEEYLKDYEDTSVLRLDDRTGVRDVPLGERTTKANNWGATILISIHHDAGANGSTSGGTTIFRYPNSSKFTKSMQQRLYNSLIKHTNLKGNRSTPLRESSFTILQRSNMASVLIENGFMDSKIDVPIILTEKHAINTAKGIVEFLVSEYKLKPKSSVSSKPNSPPLITPPSIDLPIKPTTPSTQVSQVSSWAMEGWEWAKKEGLLDGTDPKGYVTREQLATVLKRLHNGGKI